MLIHDDDVLIYWCMAGFDSSDKERCLQVIVDKWMTIRGFSFAESMMEIYKQERNRWIKVTEDKVILWQLVGIIKYVMDKIIV